MSRRKLLVAGLLALPIAIGGLVYAKATSAKPAQSGYTCPLTGEELPCPKCCPLNAKK
jgi:hypothetical protein